MSDVSIDNQGTVVALALHSDAAIAWVEEHVESEPWQWLGEHCLVVDRRFAEPLVEGMLGDGLEVE